MIYLDLPEGIRKTVDETMEVAAVRFIKEYPLLYNYNGIVQRLYDIWSEIFKESGWGAVLDRADQCLVEDFKRKLVKVRAEAIKKPCDEDDVKLIAELETQLLGQPLKRQRLNMLDTQHYIVKLRRAIEKKEKSDGKSIIEKMVESSTEELNRLPLYPLPRKIDENLKSIDVDKKTLDRFLSYYYDNYRNSNTSITEVLSSIIDKAISK